MQRRVTVIVTGGGPQPALAAKALTTTIPIVFFTGGDPVKFGLVPRYNRPGGNLTGFDFVISDLEGKRVGLVHELVPTAGVVAVILTARRRRRSWGRWRTQPNPSGSNWSPSKRAIRHSSTPPAQAEQAGAGAMLVTAVELFTVSRANRDLLVEREAKYRLPAMFSLSETTKPADSSATASIRWTATAKRASMSAASSYSKSRGVSPS